MMQVIRSIWKTLNLLGRTRRALRICRLDLRETKAELRFHKELHNKLMVRRGILPEPDDVVEKKYGPL